ncbi:MAG: MarR family transcriptional regulator [Kordiimonadales bacterium]|nr:MAG: MarR family transcriptional regulator [Kordiimonadales bacterium]
MPLDAAFSENQKTALRAWLKLLRVSGQMRKALQSKLLQAHDVSLSRFDVLANLYRAPPEGIRLSELSKQLMVTNGNVTQVLAPLIKSGLVARHTSKADARSATASLTREGAKRFALMAHDHARWVEELMQGLSKSDQKLVTELLGHLGPKDAQPATEE